MTTSYTCALQRLPRIAEHAAGVPSEADLATIWAGQRFPAGALQAVDGRGLRVLNPGRPNAGPGPDFRDAVLELGGERRRGDVELHVRASSFRGHGHHLDHAYDRLVLHVVYLADDGAGTALAGGGIAPVAAFAPWLAGRTQELHTWLQAPPLWQDPCTDADQRLGDEALARALRAAGWRRFAARVERLRAAVAVAGPRQALWAALLDALGTGGDRDGFRRLADAFPEARARTCCNGGARGLTAALLVTAGLAATGPLQTAVLSPPLRRTGRPLNWPERRLAALAALYARAGTDLPAFTLAGVESATRARALVAALQVAAAGGPALLGRERAQELAVNVALPFAALEPRLQGKVETLLAQLPPGAAYGRTSFLEANLARPGGRRRVRSALEQQGLLGLNEDWCRQGGCGRCPLS
jgi:hypothetical protein